MWVFLAQLWSSFLTFYPKISENRYIYLSYMLNSVANGFKKDNSIFKIIFNHSLNGYWMSPLGTVDITDI